MIEWHCDKCGQLVPLYNDAVALEYLLWFGRLPTVVERFVYSARHLLRTEGCEGSPSRAQCFYGELSRDTRYPRQGAGDWGHRVTYAKLVAIARKEAEAWQ